MFNESSVCVVVTGHEQRSIRECSNQGANNNKNAVRLSRLVARQLLQMRRECKGGRRSEE